MLTLRAMGRFALLDGDGVDYSPRSLKARGVIALLALSPGFSRSRTWLQEKLWSDRGHEQAAASLRQALRDIRRHLGSNCDALDGDRASVSLNASMLRVSFEPPSPAGRARAESELFEDLSVLDRRFKDWIERQRAAAGNLNCSHDNSRLAMHRQYAKPRPRIVHFRANVGTSEYGDQIARRLFTLASTAVGSDADVKFTYSTDLTNNHDIDPVDQIVAVRIAVNVPIVWISVTIADPGTGCVSWTDEIQWDERVAPTVPRLDTLAFRTAWMALDALMRGGVHDHEPTTALRLFRSAQILTMTLDKDNLAIADQQCDTAFQIVQRGSYLAWRSFIRQISHFQHMSCEFLPRQPQGGFAAAALGQFPQDSLALCMGAHAEYLFGGGIRPAFRMAELSTRGNPLNPLAWAALANLQTATSDHRGAYRSARRAADLSAGTSVGYFFEFYCCIAAAGLGDYQLATEHAQTSTRLAPRFAAPRRYLVALKAAANDGKGFRSALRSLQAIEPFFEAKLLLDSNYPINTMRRIALMSSVERRLRCDLPSLLEH
ncbi:hypothetical protein [Mesorhizobium sp. LNJC403B00]|uniref:hypothetical protein n=1 Tax=Mesorhizobium sp. LNJC403B00 TaxID=1287280 RepID=UPI0003CE24A0|nr:hypothetical protein [Mesorhizobium sp. LNJC403B00]ESX86265.1 hypothetical protein X754_28870 [Mesorhizobium sp. LNJC403B00]